MFVNFSEETRHILKQAEKEKDELNHPYVGSEHLFLSILKDSKLKNILKNNKLTYDIFKNKLISLIGVGSKKSNFMLYTPLLKRILENSVIEARERNNQIVSPEILIISILNEEDGLAYTILKSLNINIDKLYFDLKNKKNNKTYKNKKKLLDELGTDLTKLASDKKLDPIIGRDKEINMAIEILLRRKKNNPILIGPAGVGKTAIVEGIANLIVSNTCPSFLKNKKIISLNIFSLVSGTKYRGEFEDKMKNLIKELEENEDIILFLDEMHTIVGAGGAEGAIDASNILKPALARGKVRIIGATTLEEYKKFIEPDAALARRFQNVLVEEPSQDNVIKILKEIKPLYEKHHNIKISDELINDIVYLSDKYLTNRYEPDRSIDILDEACAKSSSIENYNERKIKKLTKELKNIKQDKLLALQKRNFKLAHDLKIKENNIFNKVNNIKLLPKKVTKQDIINVIRSKGNIPIINVNKKRKDFYEKIFKNLNECIYGQEENIEKLVNSLRKREILKIKKCYSILIEGPTSSGKTVLANEYLKHIVNEKNIINIDLSEYKEHHMISKLIGTTAGYVGYDNKNNVFEKVRTNPNSAIIVDNFDNACTEVQNLFIRILDKNKIDDASGKIIDFSNSTIVFTKDDNSMHKSLGFDNKEKIKNYDDSKLVKKVSLYIKMKKLDDEAMRKIIKSKIKNTVDKYLDINISIDDKYENYLFNEVKKEKDITILDKILEDEMENKIVDALINYKSKIDINVPSDIYV